MLISVAPELNCAESIAIVLCSVRFHCMTRRPGLASRQALVVSRLTSVPLRSSSISESLAKSVSWKPWSVILVLASHSRASAGDL